MSNLKYIYIYVTYVYPNLKIRIKWRLFLYWFEILIKMIIIVNYYFCIKYDLKNIKI